ncbi:MAG: hypothetical protein M3071_01965 [Actinomycetota bacterium]|nr:hypothetical protein [Actinomycetota bacterium]
MATIAPTRPSSATSQINGPAAFAARIHGKTGGFSRHGNQLAFASSAPSSSSAASASGDVWSGVQAGASPSIESAAAGASGQPAGLSSSVLAGLVIFGLGLIGLASGGAYMVVTSRRAAASAGARKRS